MRRSQGRFQQDPTCTLEWMNLGHQTFYINSHRNLLILQSPAREVKQQRGEPQQHRAERELLCQRISHRYNTNAKMGCYDHTYPHVAGGYMLTPHQSVKRDIVTKWQQDEVGFPKVCKAERVSDQEI